VFNNLVYGYTYINFLPAINNFENIIKFTDKASMLTDQIYKMLNVFKNYYRQTMILKIILIGKLLRQKRMRSKKIIYVTKRNHPPSNERFYLRTDAKAKIGVFGLSFEFKYFAV